MSRKQSNNKQKTTKEDDRETQIIAGTVPAASGSQIFLQETIKWEKKRSSNRVTKKPDRLGNNIMISKVEAPSSQEEQSLPSVYEIANSKQKLLENN